MKPYCAYSLHQSPPPPRTCVFFVPKTLSASYEWNPCAGKTVKFSKFSDISKKISAVPGKFSKPWARPTRSSKSAVFGGGGLWCTGIYVTARNAIFFLDKIANFLVRTPDKRKQILAKLWYLLFFFFNFKMSSAPHAPRNSKFNRRRTSRLSSIRNSQFNMSGGVHHESHYDDLCDYEPPGFMLDFHKSAIGSVSTLAHTFFGMTQVNWRFLLFLFLLYSQVPSIELWFLFEDKNQLKKNIFCF